MKLLLWRFLDCCHVCVIVLVLIRTAANGCNNSTRAKCSSALESISLFDARQRTNLEQIVPGSFYYVLHCTTCLAIPL